MEPKTKPATDTMPSPGWRSSTVISKSKPSVTAFLGMMPMLERITESMGGGIRVSAGGREMFSSRAYIQLQGSSTPLARRSIPVEFSECDGTIEVVSASENPEAMLQMAEFAAKGEIATGMVHDVNNLLCSISGNLEFLSLEARNKAPGMKSMVSEIQVAMEAINSAMRRMGRLLLSKKEISVAGVHELVESAHLLIKKQLQIEWKMNSKEVMVVNAVPPTLQAAMVYGDVQLAIVNIMLNAIEHGIEKKGRIEVRGYRDRTGVYIEVENDGRPVPDSVRGELLQKPVTTDCNHGYGLYASAKNLRASGGNITFESSERSTVFTITLPASCTCG